MTEHTTDSDDLHDLLNDARESLDEVFADADAFFAAEVEQVRSATIRLYGVDYELPARVPLTFNMLLARHAEDESMDAFARVLAPLFGASALQHWLDSGIDDRQLGIVLAWSIANIKAPGVISLRQAAEAYDKQQTERAEGKAPTASATSGAASSKTGPSSKRTSGGSTGSRRKRSRR
ncbi:hypothetical protein ACFVX9_30320 [Kitasatospora sp. NPDC058243]|uniref:hypothetical protein n=1 Tax=Kitasatospora sp. NPDC058243 TaxID=3346397 RepID=UPI0036DB9A8C